AQRRRRAVPCFAVGAARVGSYQSVGPARGAAPTAGNLLPPRERGATVLREREFATPCASLHDIRAEHVEGAVASRREANGRYHAADVACTPTTPEDSPSVRLCSASSVDFMSRRSEIPQTMKSTPIVTGQSATTMTTMTNPFAMARLVARKT